MKLIVSNWKMNGTMKWVDEYFQIFLSKFKNSRNRVIFSIPHVFLHHVIGITKKYEVEIFAQNCHFENNGPFTGEISTEMLSSIGVKGSIVGHSERRQFGETFQSVNKKIKSLVKNNLAPIVCIGETNDEKCNRKFVLEEQVGQCLNGVENKDIIIAYEPIWAIGNGKSMNIDDIKDSINIIKTKCMNLNFSSIKIIYGGSVNRKNVNDILSCENIDGVLIGSASLDPSFIYDVSQI